MCSSVPWRTQVFRGKRSNVCHSFSEGKLGLATHHIGLSTPVTLSGFHLHTSLLLAGLGRIGLRVWGLLGMSKVSANTSLIPAPAPLTNQQIQGPDTCLSAHAICPPLRKYIPVCVGHCAATCHITTSRHRINRLWLLIRGPAHCFDSGLARLDLAGFRTSVMLNSYVIK